MKAVTQALASFIKNTDIRMLVFLLSVMPMLLIVGSALLAEKLFEGDVPERYTASVLAISAFLLSLAGVVQIIRREAPGIMNVSFRGGIARIASR
jgi:hypothetical protein